MDSFKLGLYFIVFISAFHMLPSPVICGAREKNVLHDINTYRKVLNLPVFVKRDKASCLADEIADDLEKPCNRFREYYPVPGSNPKIPNFEKSVKKCKININTTRDGVIMPVCVPKLDPDYLFTNYTRNRHFTKYLKDSKYTIAGAGAEDDWFVVIISTNTSSGDFSSATSLLAEASKGHWVFMMAAFLSALVFLIN